MSDTTSSEEGRIVEQADCQAAEDGLRQRMTNQEWVLERLIDNPDFVADRKRHADRVDEAWRQARASEIEVLVIDPETSQARWVRR